MNWNVETYKELKDRIENNNFVYVIYSEYGCKIGFTKSPTERLENIRLGLPSQKCFFIGLYIGDRALEFEKRLHKKFKTQKIGGEWFILNDSDIDFIDNYLVENKFKCLIKKSIHWANYLLPSVYLDGKIKVIEKSKLENQVNTFEIPEIFIDSVIKPDSIFDSGVDFMTPKDISEQFERVGLKFEPQLVGRYLSHLNFKKVSKRLPEVGPRKGYYIILNINVP